METRPNSEDPKQRLCVVVSDLESAKLDLIAEELKALGLREPMLLREVGTIVGQGDVDLLPLLKKHPSVVSAFPDARVRAAAETSLKFPSAPKTDPGLSSGPGPGAGATGLPPL